MFRFSALAERLSRLWQRQLRTDERFWMAIFSLLTLLIALTHIWLPSFVAPSFLIVVLLGASFVMTSTALTYLEILIGLAVIFMSLRGDVTFGQFLGVFASVGLVMWWIRFRARHGLAGTQSDTMLIEVRERIESLAKVPRIPSQWHIDRVVRPAKGSHFSGDFIVFGGRGHDSLELALVDVSGKGTDAAARALLLQSAMGGLIGSVAFGDFLPAANTFLLRQHWEEGFATAAHIRINFDSGRYLLSLAGHPPAAFFAAGSGKWTTVGKAGDVLGVADTSRYPVDSGILNAGDALMIYTDGVIEVPGRDLLYGIDKLLGGAEQLVARSWRSGVRWLLDSLELGDGDDSSILLLRRLPSRSGSPFSPAT